MPWPCSVGMLS